MLNIKINCNMHHLQCFLQEDCQNGWISGNVQPLLPKQGTTYLQSTAKLPFSKRDPESRGQMVIRLITKASVCPCI